MPSKRRIAALIRALEIPKVVLQLVRPDKRGVLLYQSQSAYLTRCSLLLALRDFVEGYVFVDPDFRWQAQHSLSNDVP